MHCSAATGGSLPKTNLNKVHLILVHMIVSAAKWTAQLFTKMFWALKMKMNPAIPNCISTLVEMTSGPFGGLDWAAAERDAAGWCQPKWACHAWAVLAPCLLSQLLSQSPVSSTLNGSSCCYSAPAVGQSGWLMNTFSNRGTPSPLSQSAC